MLEFAVERLQTSALTGAQLAGMLFEHIGLNKRESKDMVDAFFDLIGQSLVNGRDVKLSDFGNFHLRAKAPRFGCNPRTGESIAIRERRAVAFHAIGKPKEQIQATAPKAYLGAMAYPAWLR